MNCVPLSETSASGRPKVKNIFLSCRIVDDLVVFVIIHTSGLVAECVDYYQEVFPLMSPAKLTCIRAHGFSGIG